MADKEPKDGWGSVKEMYQYYGILPTVRQMVLNQATWDWLRKTYGIQLTFTEVESPAGLYGKIPYMISPAVADKQIVVFMEDGTIKLFEIT